MAACDIGCKDGTGSWNLKHPQRYIPEMDILYCVVGGNFPALNVPIVTAT